VLVQLRAAPAAAAAIVEQQLGLTARDGLGLGGLGWGWVGWVGVGKSGGRGALVGVVGWESGGRAELGLGWG